MVRDEGNEEQGDEGNSDARKIRALETEGGRDEVSGGRESEE